MNVLVTGASGFVGSATLARLARDGAHRLRAATRRPEATATIGGDCIMIGDLSDTADWTAALRGMDVVVHAAARVHVMREAATDALAEYRRANVDGTLQLARQAVRAGVRRFVFLSSIKVNGEATEPGRPFTAADRPAPIDPYGLSKLEAERGLAELAEQTGLELVVVRPVLVYGPGVRANFRSMMRWLSLGVPLPLASVRNARSLVALDNLADLIAVLVEHPAAASEVFLVSDDEDLSTPQLLRRTAAAMGKRARLLPFPPALLELAATVARRPGAARRLTGSLQVDIAATRTRLGWTPPVGVQEALRRTTDDYLEHGDR